jgi:predicted transcriptional regulator
LPGCERGDIKSDRTGGRDRNGVRREKLPPENELSALFEAVHAAVARLAKGEERAPPPVEAQAPAVSIRKSVTADYSIRLEDGKQFKS